MLYALSKRSSRGATVLDSALFSPTVLNNSAMGESQQTANGAIRSQTEIKYYMCFVFNCILYCVVRVTEPSKRKSYTQSEWTFNVHSDQKQQGQGCHF